MLTFINTVKTIGTEHVIVKTECDITPGIGIHLVGLADAAVKESLLRSVTALMSLGYHIPGKKIVINLAPADLRKEGAGYDLSIVLGIIAASEQEPEALKDMENWLVLGEVGLDASIRQTSGAVQAVLAMQEKGLKGCIVPMANARELQTLFGTDVPVYAAHSIPEAIDIIRCPEEHPRVAEMELPETMEKKDVPSWDLLNGNECARRAIKIAAAGGHHAIFVGAPGSGKTTSAKAMLELLPPMTAEETLVNAKIYSVAGRSNGITANDRPFRAPHISASMSALLGGGCGESIRPGEVTLANNGILYLDEFAEMPKALLEGLRASLEDRSVTISRLKSKTVYPARYQLVASTNPCPCGYYGEGDRCTCTPGQRMSYLSRLSGPVMDMIDIQVWVHPMTCKPTTDTTPCESLESAREQVRRAREMQRQRYAGSAITSNAEMTVKDIESFCKLSDECKDLIGKLVEQLSLSARSYTRILKIARTIADLEGHEDIQLTDIAEAASFRFMDRRSFLEGLAEREVA